MNTRRFKTLGMTDSPGCCDLCGTNCPRRRVVVELIADDGSATGDVQCWGVVCASEARHGRRDSSLARMLRDEAEEAGTYTGPTSGRSRCPRPAIRRQTKAAAAAAAARAFTDAQAIWIRTSSPVPAGMTEDAAAWHRYRQTGRRDLEAYMAADAAGRLAVVDGADAADVARFTAAGFSADLASALFA